MPVRITLPVETGSGGFIPSDKITTGYPAPDYGRIPSNEREIFPQNDRGIPLTNFPAPWPAVWLGSSEQTRLPFQRQEGLGRVLDFQWKQDQTSRASSQETLRYPEETPSNDPFADDEDLESKEAGDDELEKVYEEYLAEGAGLRDEGVTIMLRDIQYKMDVEPHIFDLLQSTSDLSHVDYIYLPMCLKSGSDSTRNKGYCFIHFSVRASADLFVSRLEHYVSPDSMLSRGKTMLASLAKFQGLSLNLHNLLDIHSKKWRPKSGHAYIRRPGGPLVRHRLLRLRTLLKQRVAAQPQHKRRTNLVKRRPGDGA